jgi:hypothetical protein
VNFYRSSVRYINFNCAYLSFVHFTGGFVPNLIGFVRKISGFVSFSQCFVPFSRCFVQLYNNHQNSTQRQIKKSRAPTLGFSPIFLISFQTSGHRHHQGLVRYSHGHLISRLTLRYKYPRPDAPFSPLPRLQVQQSNT